MQLLHFTLHKATAVVFMSNIYTQLTVNYITQINILKNNIIFVDTYSCMLIVLKSVLHDTLVSTHSWDHLAPDENQAKSRTKYIQ